MSVDPLENHFRAVLSQGDRRMRVIRTTPFLLAAVNESGHAALYVRVSLAPSYVLADGRGFTVKTTRSGDDYVQITADAPGLPPLFLKLVEYIVERIPENASRDEGAVALMSSIDEFRSFVSRRGGRLSEPEVRGTFAELWYLQHLLDSGMNALVAVGAWRGPWSKIGLGLHDFTFEEGPGIEIKSTRQPPTTIRVSSANQLIPSSEPLELLVLPLEQSRGTNTQAVPFRDFATDLGNRLRATGSEAGEIWDDSLSALHLDLSDEWYDRYRFLPGSWRRFEVIEGFPYLDIANLPLGIVDIQYSIELNRLVDFEIPFGIPAEERGTTIHDD